MITIELIMHHGEACYALRFGYNIELKKSIKELSFIRYSATHKCFYLFTKHWSLDKLTAALDGKKITHRFGKHLKEQQQKEKVVTTDYKDATAVLTEFRSYLHGLRLSPRTIECYATFIRNFIDFLNSKPLEAVTNQDVRLFVEREIQRKNYAISTHRQLISAMQHFAHLHLESGIVADDLVRPLKSRYLPIVLSMEEVLDLLRVTQNLKHRTALALLYSSGLRIGELISLELSMINIDRRQLFVKNGKGRKDRVVVLAESFIPLFKNYYMTYEPKRYFIENPKGGKYNAGSVRQFLKQSCKAAGIKKRVTPHTLRHSYATHLIEQGVGLRYVQDLLGHAKPETTMIYTHVAKKDLLNIKSPLDRAISALGESNNSRLKLPFSGNLSG